MWGRKVEGFQLTIAHSYVVFIRLMAPEIILFGYDQSPYFQKLKLILLFKELPFKLVKVSRILPRPELTSLGINYRRIPILSIGGSVYCDTAVAVSALENVFPQKYLGWKENVAVNLQERAIFSIAVGNF